MKNLLSPLAAAFALGLPACQSVEQKAPPVALLDTASPELCEEGRQIFTTNCTECHGLRDVHYRTLTEWRAEILPAMAKKAKISPQQEEAVLAYIAAALETPPEKR